MCKYMAMPKKEGKKTYHNIVNVDITLTATIQGKEEYFHELNRCATNFRAQYCNSWGHQCDPHFFTGG